jgi:hypothetical protein
VFRHSIKISHANPFSLLQHLDFCINGSGVSVVIDLKGSEHNYLKRSGVMCFTRILPCMCQFAYHLDEFLLFCGH